MRGLIWKDALVLRKTMRAYLIVMAMFVWMAVMDLFEIAFVISMAMMMVQMFAVSAFAYDDQARWYRYGMAMPGGRRMVVAARYCFALLCVGAAALFGLAASALAAARGEPFTENAVMTVFALGIGLLLLDIILPVFYCFPAERARMVLYAIVFVPCFGVALLSRLGVLSLAAEFAPGAAPLGILFAAAAAGFPLSWWISCRITAGKEY